METPLFRKRDAVVLGSSFLLSSLAAEPWKSLGRVTGALVSLRMLAILQERMRSHRVQESIAHKFPSFDLVFSDTHIFDPHVKPGVYYCPVECVDLRNGDQVRVIVTTNPWGDVKRISNAVRTSL